MEHLLDILDLTTAEIDKLIDVACDIKANPDKYCDSCKRKKLATLFFEPSTRTRLSFESAMLELGGSVIGFSDASNSSIAKGESVADTISVVASYADITAMRHPLAGAPKVASDKNLIPIINAGDGGHNHPTQTLADLMTIKDKFNRLDNLTIGVCGDLKYGRTVHSLTRAMARYSNNKFIFISPKELQIPDYIKKELDEKSIQYIEVCDLESSMTEVDILYMTRIQKERFADIEEYERLKNSYILDTDKMKLAKENMIVLHPLPRVNEISVEVDNDKRACYFYQALCGKYIRMALILHLLSCTTSTPAHPPLLPTQEKCNNPKCITSTEQEIKHYVKNGVCQYCEEKIK